MKKLKNLIVAFILCISSIAILSACDAKVENAEVKSGTLATTIVKNATLDTSELIVIFNYSDGTTLEVPASELIIGTIDTSTQGVKKLRVTYGKYSFDIDINVVATEADVSTITTLTSQLLTDYESNRSVQTNKQTEFVDRNQPLYVGDDNALDFRLKAYGIDGSGELVTDITKVRTEIVVEEKNGSDYTILSGDALDNIVSIDTENTLLDFTENAIGKEFRVTVTAANRDETYGNCSFATNIVVIDAYNVYNARDLSVYDNYHSSYDSIRPTNDEVHGVVLLNDIDITKDDVRQDMFWTGNEPSFNTYNSYTDQELKGTPYDNSGEGIYYRTFNNGDIFNFKGNYFSLNLSSFPKMVVEGTGTSVKPENVVNTEKGKEKYMTAHMSVFFNTIADEVTPSTKTELNWNDIYFIGNGELNADPINSGAIILSKARRINYTAKNTITHNFYITNFLDLGEKNNPFEGNYTLEDNKGYNSYQCLLYVWGAKNLKIINSEYKNAGGPAIIADHVSPDRNGNGGYPSHIDIINSQIESKVSGQEPWFTVYKAASLVSQILDAEQLYSGKSFDTNTQEMVDNGLPHTGKSIVSSTAKNENGATVNQLNLVVAMKSGDAQGLTPDRIDGYVRMFDSMEDYNKYYNKENPEETTFGLDMNLADSLMNLAFNKGLVFFESNGNGGYISNGFNGTTNRKASFVEGTVKANVLYNILIMGSGEYRDTIESALAGFSNMSLAEQKTALCGVIDMILTIPNALETLTAVYQNGMVVGDQYGTSNENNYYPIEAVEDTDILSDANTLATELKRQISNYSDYSYADGNHVNIYLFNGMGAIIGLYDATENN